ncbi:uncharacterized protein LOC116198940 isoform X1 [Punica granatum]|uniref:Uncharacterized protein LOC116198940 isoform X1 n=1 Tax=Punica granatum TaxID=22663 RepID=A0A6P8CNI8_PUNGR|nr:uncharacterized protein LOC116198940 isoform X1 [Punica granatum]
MDSVASSALEEICAQGSTGLTLSSLWPKLAPQLSSAGLGLSLGVKSSVWANLLKIPGLEFHARNAALAPTDPSIQCVEDAEKMKLKIVARESLRDNFVGLYDAQSASANISSRQRQTLERLAAARENGVTQSQLGKEFNMEGKYIFYILKNLESRGLIMRQSAVLRTKEAFSEGESRNGPCVTTNVVYLHRYAKHLGLQQKIEITKEGRAGSSRNASEALAIGGCPTEDLTKDMIVKDYLPAMQAVCDKLESAEGKVCQVLVVSDIKRDLGYAGAPAGHKAWRTICRRLKDAGVVEELEAKVNEKVHSCLRLLKKFPVETNEPNLFSSGNNGKNEEVAQFGRKRHISEQVIELPLEHQVFDMVIAEGSVGVTLKEVCERLGLDNKRNHTRVLNIVSRFGMHLAAENHGKGVAYRVWAPKSFGGDATNTLPCKSKSAYNESRALNLDGHGSDAPNLLDCTPSVSEGKLISAEKTGERENDEELQNAILEDGEADEALNRQEVLPKPGVSGVGLDLALVVPSDENSVTLYETPASQKSSKSGLSQRYPCLSQTADATQREQRILGRVQEEKFILRAELYKWLVSLEKDKCTTMDRKTIDRIVNKLQKQGHCKCVEISVPSFTNCSRNRRTQVILHPSVEHLSPPLLSEIHDRLRSFEMQSRGHGSSKSKDCESVPVLEGVQRIQSSVGSDATSNTKHEAMRANGFVLAKMIRAKLLHCFIWDYLHSLPDNNLDILSSASNPHSSYWLFSLEEAIKAIPVELFLQVAGSAQKFDDMMEKCRSGLRLVDLPVEQYRILMDTLATARLSLVIDILRRLKLIRLVNNGHREEGVKVPHAILTHAMELKPYIEEPLSMLAHSFNFISLDLRPRVRHDFILSSKEAVDEYWHTLEYCYATADPKAAIHAFPGSTVHEVFYFRSWASARVMTAEQRAELLKRVVKDSTSEKLSFKECEKIAKDLNLTLEQVLRVYHDKRQKRLTRFQGTVAEEGGQTQTSATQPVSATRKRRSSSKVPSANNNVDPVNDQLNHEDIVRFSDGANRFRGELAETVVSLEEHETVRNDFCTEEPRRNIEMKGCSNENTKPIRQKRSSWTDEADRQMVIQYVKHRAERGAKFQRAGWSSLSDLPAPPSACGKRIACLKKNKVFRRALMRLINVVSKRYVRHLQKLHNKIGDGIRLLVRSSLTGDGDRSIPVEAQLIEDEEQWDDFSCPSVKRVLEEVLRCKRITNLEASKEIQSDSEEFSNLNKRSGHYASQVRQSVSSGSPHEDNWKEQDKGNQQGSLSRSKRRRLQKKFTRLFNKEYPVNRHIYESLAVSNAVELFKLIFLNTSSAPGMSNILAESLRHYSEHDLFAAFRYLRERKILIGGTGNMQYELPLNFIQNMSRSMFPANTGRRISRCSRWLHEREKDLNEGEIALAGDLQCGDVVHLFSLVSHGEISIFPLLPEEGVGEAEDPRNSKRRRAVDESPDSSRTKKSKYVADDVSARRDKGFPGIMVCARREAIERAKVVELSSRNAEFDPHEVILDPPLNELDTGVEQGESDSTPDRHIREILRSPDLCNSTINAVESPWDAMACYAEKVMLMPSDPESRRFLCPEVFKNMYGAIQRAGDQGLSMEEVSQIAHKPGEKALKLLIDVLQSFGRVVKVNAFDAVRVVDALYRPKYFLSLLPDTCQDQGQQSSIESRGGSSEGHSIHEPNHDHSDDKAKQDTPVDTDQMHKVTLLNLPEETDGTLSEVQNTSVSGSSSYHNNVNPPESNIDLEIKKFSLSEFCVPIVPWMNGDGTINRVVYKGLLRRVLGIVMLNPGILEDNIIQQLDVLNPQSCRTLLESMILEKHLIVRKMRQTAGSAPPSMLQSVLRSGSKESKSIFREHFFANSMSAYLL